jgi:hypothetical protein
MMQLQELGVTVPVRMSRVSPEIGDETGDQTGDETGDQIGD